MGPWSLGPGPSGPGSMKWSWPGGFSRPSVGPGSRSQKDIMIRDRVNPITKVRAKWLRNHPTEVEGVLWNRLRKNRLGFSFRRQSVIRGYIVDFYCPRLHLVIEVDGLYHLSRQRQDGVRDKVMERLGICVLRFSNDAVLNRTDETLGVICLIMSRRSRMKIGATISWGQYTIRQKDGVVTCPSTSL